MDHAIYDKRRYPIVEVREGYAEWVRTYEQTVQDEMDLRLLERLAIGRLGRAASVLDLACGTGRVGAWLKGRCSAALDGIDITPEMLEVARAGASTEPSASRTLRTPGSPPRPMIFAPSRSRTSTCPTSNRFTGRWHASPGVGVPSSSWVFTPTS